MIESKRALRLLALRSPADILSLVYSNSLLATLNSRGSVRAALKNPTSMEVSGSRSFRQTNGAKEGHNFNRSASPLGSLSFAKRTDVGGGRALERRSLVISPKLDSAQDVHNGGVYDG
jgi:hypothetical protein